MNARFPSTLAPRQRDMQQASNSLLQSVDLPTYSQAMAALRLVQHTLWTSTLDQVAPALRAQLLAEVGRVLQSPDSPNVRTPAAGYVPASSQDQARAPSGQWVRGQHG